MAFEITALREPLGAEVRGWKPELALDDEALAQLRRALRRHLVLVLRGQRPPSDDELTEFAGSFGELAPGATIFSDRSSRPEVLPISNLVDEHGDPVGTASSAALNWHLDYSYMPRTAKETFLEAVEIPDTPCPTHVCDTYVALESLPRDWVARLEGLEAHHDVRGAVPEEDRHFVEEATRRKKERNRREGIRHERIPDSTYPAIRRHPESGRAMLFVSPGMTTHLVGVDREESSEMLEFLFEHQVRPECCYTHQWQVGDLIIFDAMGVMHARDRIDPTARRYMRQLSTLV